MTNRPSNRDQSPTDSSDSASEPDGVLASSPRAVYASDLKKSAVEATGKKRGGKPGRAATSELAGKPSVGTPTEPKRLGLQAPEGLPLEDRPAAVLKLAEQAFAMTGSWVVFYREILSPGGAVDQLYETAELRRYFESTDEFAELLEIVTSIRSQDDSKVAAHEPERVITIRMPRSMHEATVREAGELGLSINKYCLTKLLQPANSRYTPLESGGRRGRRPGPQIIVGKTKVKPKSRKAPPK